MFSDTYLMPLSIKYSINTFVYLWRDINIVMSECLLQLPGLAWQVHIVFCIWGTPLPMGNKPDFVSYLSENKVLRQVFASIENGYYNDCFYSTYLLDQISHRFSYLGIQELKQKLTWLPERTPRAWSAFNIMLLSKENRRESDKCRYKCCLDET